MKRFLTLLWSLLFLCGCASGGIKTVCHHDVCFSYDASRYDVTETDDNGYDFSFRLVERDCRDNAATFHIIKDALFLDMDGEELASFVENELAGAYPNEDEEFRSVNPWPDQVKEWSDPRFPDSCGGSLGYCGQRGDREVNGRAMTSVVRDCWVSMFTECASGASADAFVQIFKEVQYPAMPVSVAETTPDDDEGDEGYEDETCDNGDTWEMFVLGDLISLGFDNMEYTGALLEEKPDELIFRLEGLGDEGDGTSGVFRFRIAGSPLDTSDEESWQDALQEELRDDLAGLLDDSDFTLDGRFSPWYMMDADYGVFIQYMGTWSGDRYVQGLFASKGEGNCRATMQAEGPDEEAVMRMLHLFEDVRFHFD